MIGKVWSDIEDGDNASESGGDNDVDKKTKADSGDCVPSTYFPSASSCSAFDPIPTKLLRGKDFLEFQQEEKSNLSDDIDSKQDGDTADAGEDDFFSSVEFLETVATIGEDNNTPTHSPFKIKSRGDSPPPKPTKEELDLMTEEEAAMAMSRYRNLRKKWTDMKLRQRKKFFSSGTMVEYTGDMTPSLRLMSEAEARRLNPRDSFENKEVLRMRIAEEANLRGVWITTIRSDSRVLLVVGDKFYVKANNSERNGWVVTTAIVRLGDGNLPDNSVTRQLTKRLAEEARLDKKSKNIPIADDVDIQIIDEIEEKDEEIEEKDKDIDDMSANDSDDDDDGKEKTRKEEGRRSHPSPYQAQWLVPIIRGTIANAPMTSNHHLKQLLLPYGNDYALTKTIINSARSLAKDKIFGMAAVNCKYFLALRDELVLRGNFVEVIFTTRIQAINRLLLVVIQEEVRRRKAAGTGDHAQLGTVTGAKEFVSQWKSENNDFVNEHFGVEGNNWRFVQGILFATSTSKTTAPWLQRVVQADAAHLRFGKYTLYSAFGITAEAQCSSIAYAIIFGNEDTASWTQFWKFAVTIHPFLNSGKYVIITDYPLTW